MNRKSRKSFKDIRKVESKNGKMALLKWNSVIWLLSEYVTIVYMKN